MNSKIYIKRELEKFKKNELIFANKLYREKLSEKITEPTYYKSLERMCDSGELVKIAKATYYIPKHTKYGIVPPSERDIIEAFTENRTGTVVGYTLYNSLNLTTQISKNITVLSSALETFEKSIRNITVHQVQIDYSNEVSNMIHGLEVLQNFSKIQDINYQAFVKFSQKLAESYNEKVFNKVITTKKYKKSTISFLREILNYYKKENNLERYLSALSEYKHPKMEEIYEIARI